MAKCKHCGAKAGFMAEICPSCLVNIQNARAAEQRENVDERETTHTAQSATGQALSASVSTPTASKYEAARIVAAIGEFIGWIIVLVGIVLVFVAASKELGATGIGIAIAVGIAGLYLVMMAQFVRATVDNADTTREMLRLMRERG